MSCAKEIVQSFPASSMLSPGDAKILLRKHEIQPSAADQSSGPSTYHTLACLCIIANLGTAGILFVRREDEHLEHLLNISVIALSANFCACVAIRNDHVINTISRIACSLPQSAPIYIRIVAARVYCHGGVHSGCAISGSFWYIVFTCLCFLVPQGTPAIQLGLTFVSGMALLLLATILIFSHPLMRARFHNLFETIHRFLGWSFVVVLWIQTLLMNLTGADRNRHMFTQRLVLSPAFWLLLVITVLLVYPWTRLRLCAVKSERLSDRVLRLTVAGVMEQPCMTRRFATIPLKETHAFATIPSKDSTAYAVYVCAAGDWTKMLTNKLPEKIWIKGCPTYGATYSSSLFRKVLFVTTGSAIAPVLSVIQSRPVCQTTVLWITKDPLCMFDTKLLQELEAHNKNLFVVNRGHADIGPEEISALAYALHHETQSEAVYVISNRIVTDSVKSNLERNNVPVFGPIFDS